MSKTLSQRRLDRIHQSVGREVCEQFFSDPHALEPLISDPTLLRRALLEAISPHPRAGELRNRNYPTTAACLNLIDSLVREATAEGQIEGITIEFAREKLAEKLDHAIALKTISEMIRRNSALHDLVAFNNRIRLRGDLLVRVIDARHQMKLRQQQSQQAQQSWEAWS